MKERLLRERAAILASLEKLLVCKKTSQKQSDDAMVSEVMVIMDDRFHLQYLIPIRFPQTHSNRCTLGFVHPDRQLQLGRLEVLGQAWHLHHPKEI